MANNINKVRIIVVGDSGVGKTCLTHLIAYNEALPHPGWTVGCNIEVKLYEYKEGTPQQSPYFIELFDIGGSISHKNTRNVFYAPVNGIVLVHDLTNRKSHFNLRDWVYEILDKEGKDTCKGVSVGGSKNGSPNNTQSSTEDRFDPEEFVGITQIPMLVVGTKLDLLDEKHQQKSSVAQKAGGIGKTEQIGAEEIWLNCRNPAHLAAGTTDAVKLSRFFDLVIEKKSNSRETGNYSGIERRSRYISPSPDSSLLLSPTFIQPKSTSTPRPQVINNLLLEGSGLQ